MRSPEYEITVEQEEKSSFFRPLTEKLRGLTNFIKENKGSIKMYAMVGLIALGIAGMSFTVLSETPSLIDGLSIATPMRGFISLIAGGFIGGLSLNALSVRS